MLTVAYSLTHTAQISSMLYLNGLHAAAGGCMHEVCFLFLNVDVLILASFLFIVFLLSSCSL